MKKILIPLLTLICMLLINGCEKTPETSVKMGSTEVNEFLDVLFMEELQQSPQSLTYLGLRDRYGEWNDISDKARDASMEMTREHLEKVRRLDLAMLMTLPN